MGMKDLEIPWAWIDAHAAILRAMRIWVKMVQKAGLNLYNYGAKESPNLGFFRPTKP